MCECEHQHHNNKMSHSIAIAIVCSTIYAKTEPRHVGRKRADNFLANLLAEAVVLFLSCVATEPNRKLGPKIDSTRERESINHFPPGNWPVESSRSCSVCSALWGFRGGGVGLYSVFCARERTNKQKSRQWKRFKDYTHFSIAHSTFTPLSLFRHNRL